MNNMIIATSGAGLAYPSRAPDTTPGFFGEVHVDQYLVSVLCFEDSYLPFPYWNQTVMIRKQTTVCSNQRP